MRWQSRAATPSRGARSVGHASSLLSRFVIAQRLCRWKLLSDFVSDRRAEGWSRSAERQARLGGPDGFYAPFIVQNVGTTTTDLQVSFYRFSDGSLVTCRKITGVGPGTSFADVPNNDGDLPGNSQFSVVVRSFGAQVARGRASNRNLSG